MKTEINGYGKTIIKDIPIDDDIFNEEKSEYTLRDREEVINDLINWISETEREEDKPIMKEDLKYLMGLDDEYIFSSISTNKYIAKSDNDVEFNRICDEILKLNKKYAKRKK